MPLWINRVAVLLAMCGLLFLTVLGQRRPGAWGLQTCAGL